ncbi:unnamed protein product [Tuber aestivum]|uniref:Uncharacterized protein n=1 Tax=Tuber aestivum TaxID=59557 RepID=A0A292PYY2_9PEZI|nr:unnamed protein product [Tuber aestivum]
MDPPRWDDMSTLGGYSTAQASVRLTPFTIATSIGSLEAGLIINATGKYYILGQTVTPTSVQGVLPICAFSLTIPLFSQLSNLFMAGSGYGGTLTIALLGLISQRTTFHLPECVSEAIARAFGSGEEADGILERLGERFDEFDGLFESEKAEAGGSQGERS